MYLWGFGATSYNDQGCMRSGAERHFVYNVLNEAAGRYLWGFNRGSRPLGMFLAGTEWVPSCSGCDPEMGMSAGTVVAGVTEPIRSADMEK